LSVRDDIANERHPVERALRSAEPIKETFNGNTVWVYFDTGKASLSAEASATIAQAANAFKAGGRSVAVTGHTDTTGAADYNLQLSRQRAAAIYESWDRNRRILPEQAALCGPAPCANTLADNWSVSSLIASLPSPARARPGGGSLRRGTAGRAAGGAIGPAGPPTPAEVWPWPARQYPSAVACVISWYRELF
jgi:hypothetical protein